MKTIIEPFRIKTVEPIKMTTVEQRKRLIKEADGEAKRFVSVYEAYLTGKDVTLRRLYLERMQDVLGKADKVIVDKGQGGPGVVPYLPLPEIKKRSQGAQ